MKSKKIIVRESFIKCLQRNCILSWVLCNLHVLSVYKDRQISKLISEM